MPNSTAIRPRTNRPDALRLLTSDIETIKDGQQSVTRDPATGTNVETFRGTPEHHFFMPNGVMEMGQLKPGMSVYTSTGVNPLVVKTATRGQDPEGVTVYNFEVEGDHTYLSARRMAECWCTICARPISSADHLER
ncbi:MAG TPA: hypothetical protein VHV83_21725 [Armatimonadota bacterium]|nr:hypothetical protein [Armatimonadota bacterium]